MILNADLIWVYSTPLGIPRAASMYNIFSIEINEHLWYLEAVPFLWGESFDFQKKA